MQVKQRQYEIPIPHVAPLIGTNQALENQMQHRFGGGIFGKVPHNSGFNQNKLYQEKIYRDRQMKTNQNRQDFIPLGSENIMDPIDIPSSLLKQMDFSRLSMLDQTAQTGSSAIDKSQQDQLTVPPDESVVVGIEKPIELNISKMKILQKDGPSEANQARKKNDDSPNFRNKDLEVQKLEDSDKAQIMLKIKNQSLNEPVSFT